MDIQTYYKDNQEQIEEEYVNHLEELWLHNSDYGRLSQSEAYFWEWLEEVVDKA